MKRTNIMTAILAVGTLMLTGTSSAQQDDEPSLAPYTVQPGRESSPNTPTRTDIYTVVPGVAESPAPVAPSPTISGTRTNVNVEPKPEKEKEKEKAKKASQDEARYDDESSPRSSRRYDSYPGNWPAGYAVVLHSGVSGETNRAGNLPREKQHAGQDSGDKRTSAESYYSTFNWTGGRMSGGFGPDGADENSVSRAESNVSSRRSSSGAPTGYYSTFNWTGGDNYYTKFNWTGGQSTANIDTTARRTFTEDARAAAARSPQRQEATRTEVRRVERESEK